VCELAHNRTVKECRAKRIQLDCGLGGKLTCEDDCHEHADKEDTRYTAEAQAIFDRHYDHVTEITGI
jgi:hypothetical protein